MELQQKIALVTGGGRGIGRGIVDRFLEEGARVAVVQRQSLDDVLDGHPRVAHVKADLSVAASAGTAVEQTVERFGGIDILVNNAGILFERSVAEIQLAEWDLMMAVNLRAPLFLAQAALPHLRARGGGSIINIGSIEGLGANPDHAAYCASKAGVHGMTRAVAVDLGADNIRCNAIAPGWIAPSSARRTWNPAPTRPLPGTPWTACTLSGAPEDPPMLAISPSTWRVTVRAF
jgi:meso-butanediol dehydrogenase/(S,S)-butanediol dehydrogenase/diacetyl reductase